MATRMDVDVDTGGRSGPDPTRRWLGVAVLTLAAVAVLILPGLIRPDVSGKASPLVPPPPPPVRACVLLMSGVPEVVDCEVPHTGEILMAWPADSGPAGAGLSVAGSAASPTIQQDSDLPPATEYQMNTCYGLVSDYSGYDRELPVADGWLPVFPAARVSFIVAPEADRVGDRGWSACIMTTWNFTKYSGSLRGLKATSGPRWQDSFGNCFDEDTVALVTACSTPHRTEYVASWFSSSYASAPTFYANLSPLELTNTCFLIAATVLRTDDPTYSGRLAVKAQSIFSLRNPGEASGNVDKDGRDVGFPPDCYVEVVGPELLTGTLVGLGDGPLPIG